MGQDFYETELIILTCCCGFFILVEYILSRRKKTSRDAAEARMEDGGVPNATISAKLMRQYLFVYVMVMGADWLQGPYVYSLYREQYKFPERIVALLFVTGFSSGALTAPLVGAWADQFGRKKICLVFCITYSLSCACIFVRYLPILLIGRSLGGISGSILFSAFESWLISSSNGAGVSDSDLSRIMGRASLINGLVATGAGVVSNRLVSSTGNFGSPFLLSGAILVLAWFVIARTWQENYGSNATEAGTQNISIFQIERLAKAWRIARQDKVLLVLGLTQTCFEGSMYLFVFLWVPSLQEASHSSNILPLPLGYIFSAFMISMMLGSLLYTTITSHVLASPSKSNDRSLSIHAKLSSLVCAISGLALAASVSSRNEKIRFWCFCVFEACVGIYYPVQGMLRGTLIPNEHRATLSSLFRVPLNVFVVVSLLTGVSSARYAVLSASSVMLGFSAIMTGLVIVNHADKYSV
ncbi:hypothetical protein F5876DRAFT_87178 [Lentinula aff. lateritia]|uniref:Uncharacterized protein n=1 Tax=Lentinula aff. lateritia TaxID=2804960 RepID=A0ACC1U9A5_9AGAR|nr:hypothetical protein F5876DRAFT_87178 [Lentinula aff. lateritia]